MALLDIFKPDPNFKGGQNTTQKGSTGFFKKDPDKTLDIFGGNVPSGIAPDPDFRPGMGTDPEYQAQIKATRAAELKAQEAESNKKQKAFIDLPDVKDPKLTFGQKLNKGLDAVFNMQENNPEAYRKVMSGLDIYLRGQRGDDLATAILGNSKFNAEQASALVQSSIKANELKASEMKVLKAEKDLTTPDKVEKGELEIAKNIIKKDVNKDDIEAVANFIASRAKTIQLNTGVGFSEAITIAYQLAQQEGGGLKNIASLYGKEFTIDPQGISNVSEDDHIKANDKAKEAGQDAYTLGGKTYKVQ
tara:strand:+ start:298 stop:1209 length:912 start_codon:yes stop_codon:yes gene_type:complete